MGTDRFPDVSVRLCAQLPVAQRGPFLHERTADVVLRILRDTRRGALQRAKGRVARAHEFTSAGNLSVAPFQAPPLQKNPASFSAFRIERAGFSAKTT